MASFNNSISVVVLTYNRAAEVLHTLAHMHALAEQPEMILVDNASTDDTCELVREKFPEVRIIRLNRNIGAAARNVGVEVVRTPYVAFCDDDSWWAPGTLARAANLLDATPRLAAVCASILLGPEQKKDPVCDAMASSPLPSDGLPGPALLGFIACAVVFRRDAYLEAGGYEAKFFVGGEEELLALDLVARGWRLAYVDDLVAHHHPSSYRDTGERQHIVVRNALWVAWMRLPLAIAVRQTWRVCQLGRRRRVLKSAVLAALQELPWILRERRVIPRDTLSLYRTLRG